MPRGGVNRAGGNLVHARAKLQPLQHPAGVPLSSPPPFRVKDVIFTTQYAQGRFQSTGAHHEKGATVQHHLVSPMTGQRVYQFHEPKGGQAEGF